MEAASVEFIKALGLFVVVAAGMGLVGRVFRMPSIVSYLIAGLIVGPLAGWTRPSGEPHDALGTIAEMGIVLLMFLVGLELSLARIRNVGKVALAAGLGQVLFTAAGGLGISLLLGFAWMESLFISTALTFSSTVVVVKLLDQKNELQSLYGRIAVGIFLVQDLVVVIILTLLAGLGRSESFTPLTVAAGLGKAFGGMALLLGVSLLAAGYVLPRALAWAAGTPRVLFMWSLAWCFGYVLTARALGLSLEIGAFLAGLSIAQLDVATDIRRRMHPLMSFFVAIFFVSLGARMELSSAAGYWVEALVLSLFVLIGNPIIFMTIIARYGYSEKTSFLTSVTVAQISEFSFIFAAMGVSTGLIGEQMLSLIAVVGIVTIALSAYMILYNHPLYALIAKTRLLRVFRAGQRADDELPAEELSGHVVVVGMNDLGRRLVEELHGRGQAVLAIDSDPGKLAGLPCRTLAGDVDYLSTLKDAGIERARLAISALRIEAANKLFAFRCRAFRVPVVCYGYDDAMVEQLARVGADHIVESRTESGRRFIEELERIGAVPP
jgi:Kef-type K+ transport system membrane component KefB